MLFPCVLYALATCLRVALCVISDPSASSDLLHGSTTQPVTITAGNSRSGQHRTGSELVLGDTQRQLWLAVGNVLPTQGALLPTALLNQVTSDAKVTTLLPSGTLTEIPTPTSVFHPLNPVTGGAAGSQVTEIPGLRAQVRRGAPGNATATSRPPTTIRETTTVYVETDSCTSTPTPTSTMARHSVPISDAGQKGGIAGGTVGAVLIVAVLTFFCYRRARRRIRNRNGFLSLSDSSSTSSDAERGEVAHGGLFGSDNKTASAAESFATDVSQAPDPAAVMAAEEESTTSEQVPICFRPSRRLISRYPSLPVTLTPRASIRLSDYLNPVIRDSVLLPRPLRRAGRATLGRSQSWQAGPPPRNKQPPSSGSGPGSRSRSTTVTSSSVYSSDVTFDFAEYVTIGARTSRATATTQRASGTTDASGLRSTLAHFPRPPPYTFTRGDGRGLGTSWRESFVFSTPEDEVLLAFPRLARQIGEDLV